MSDASSKEREQWEMRDIRHRVTDITAAAAFAVVLGISSIWGLSSHENAAAQGKVAVRNGAADAQDSAGIQGGAGTQDDMVMQGAAAQRGDVAFRVESSPMDGGGSESAGIEETIYLDVSQAKALRDISGALEQQRLEDAARIMEREEESLLDLFYNVMNGRRLLYDGLTFQTEIDGRGMVFTKAGTVFYGTFSKGKPEGQCTALQAVNLDAPRYDYSQGMWKDGRMDGPGHTGYCYYERIPRGESRDICRTGTFTKDRMEGGVTYTSMNGEDEISIWKFNVKNGVVVKDDRWYYINSTGEYQLLSEDNDSHAYVLGENQMMQPMWQNMLVWEE